MTERDRERRRETERDREIKERDREVKKESSGQLCLGQTDEQRYNFLELLSELKSIFT